ncbi:membrane-bound lytic murein transglycosylase F [Agarivorans sp. OAG1]|uniref:Membrane-bound lytic murein transglycosylase F n=1 Tax=Agarivorans albus MKT 106 TaxID=1331007 RepID=R9PTK9_AGAAL|nr:membrane-bound lytic murein transglycosylase MltF [Agarivorans albus]BEU04193.1 membrane-bound lytic murein transglycosylase F [Agarivorans sp. OAG1]GAD02601.1 transglycosylase [Agarivorans albus MKT 106]
MIKQQRFTLLLALLALFVLQGCEPNPFVSELEQIRQRGKLRVGTLYSQQIFYYDQHEQPTGMEYELLEDFANYLGVELQMVPLYNQTELYRGLHNNQVDLLAAALSPTNALRENFRFSPEIYKVDAKVVYKKNTRRPRDISQVDSPLWITTGSYHQPLLKSYRKEHPELAIEATDRLDSSELLKSIVDEDIRFALVDDTTLALHQRFYPDLAEAFTLSESTSVVWMVNRLRDDSLYSALIEFIGDKHSNGDITRLYERYFGHIQRFDYVDTRAFLRSTSTRLPKYEDWFKQYAGKLDWRLIAAVSYQESHWRPHAKSFTGVRGMMMLTLPTAKSVGVTNRLDPEQSIRGGAEYLQKLINRVPDSVREDDKIWFALVSYNIGFGHMLDARRITRMRGGDPDAWVDVKENLPLLMRKKWYQQTRYGYARGQEAYNYVNNIRQYYQSLLWLDAQKKESQRRQELMKNRAPYPVNNPSVEASEPNKTEVDTIN